MLWADDDPELPNNYFSALAQFNSLERRLDKDPELKAKYEDSNINEDLTKGYVIKVDNPQEPQQSSKTEWYLPHHPVINPNKPGKVRRVLNGAAKFRGVSLNNSLLTGPDLLQKLIHVLIRFRQREFAVSADIEGMFLQVGVLEKDQPCLRFLWREDPSKMLRCTSTRAIYSEQRILLRAPILHCRKRLETTSQSIPMQRKRFLTNFTWVTTLNPWIAKNRLYLGLGSCLKCCNWEDLSFLSS